MKIRGKPYMHFTVKKNIVHFFLSPPTPTHRPCSFVQLTTVRRCHKQRKGNTTIFGKRLRQLRSSLSFFVQVCLCHPNLCRSKKCRKALLHRLQTNHLMLTTERSQRDRRETGGRSILAKHEKLDDNGLKRGTDSAGNLNCSIEICLSFAALKK